MKDLYLIYVRQSDDNRRGFAGEVRASSEEEARTKARDCLGVTAPEGQVDVVRGVPEVSHQLDENFARKPWQGQAAPEPATESELRLLAYAYTDSCLVAEDSEDRDSAIEDEVQGPGGGLEQLQSAYIAVFRNYITGGPGYAGTVYLILWDGAPEFVSVAFWEREPKRIKMIHYGDV